MGGKAFNGRRISREEGLAVAETVRQMLGDCISRFEVCGSIRREKPDIGDVDLVVIAADPLVLNAKLARVFGFLKTRRGVACKSGLIDGVQVEIGVATEKTLGSELMHHTGSGDWNVMMRTEAIKQNKKLSNYGLFHRVTGEYLAGDTEESIFQGLGMGFVDPKNRRIDT